MFKDKDNNFRISSLGFNKIDFLTTDKIKELKILYESYIETSKSTDELAVTHRDNNFQNSTFVNIKIIDIISESLDLIFSNYKVLASHFVVKKAHSGQDFQLHQDWNVVDESKFYNYQVWIPLELSYPENGGICFVPESHLFFNNIRSGSLGITNIPIEEKLYPYLAYLRLFPGEAAVFFSKTFHGSFKNSTSNDRVAVLVNIIQEKATPLYFHKELTLAKGYPINTNEIFLHLPQLEKGILPFEKEHITEISLTNIDNNEISADELIEKIQEYNFKNQRHKRYEHKLLHIIKDKSLEHRINEQGYAVVDFLDLDALIQLKIKFNEMFPDRSIYEGAFAGINTFDVEKRKEMHEFIRKTITPYLNKFFEDFYLPISSFYSRKPDKKFTLDWHSDPSFIFNENIESIYGIWSPLIDVEENCGTLKIVPKSHRLLNKLHFSYVTTKWSIENHRRILDKYAKMFSLKAGQAIIFDGRIIHASDPNKSNIYRDNIVMRVNHKDSNYFNIKTNSNEDLKGSVYKQDKDYFYSEAVVKHNLIPSTGKKVGEMYFFCDQISEDFINLKLED